MNNECCASICCANEDNAKRKKEERVSKCRKQMSLYKQNYFVSKLISSLNAQDRLSKYFALPSILYYIIVFKMNQIFVFVALFGKDLRIIEI